LPAPVAISILRAMGRLWIACFWWLAGCGFQSRAASIADADVAGDGDIGMQMVDASLCFDGFTRVCLAALPTTALVVGSSMTIDTTTGCAETTMGTAREVCVVARTMIEVATGAVLRATGTRPLILLATTSIVIAGTLDAASHRAGTAGPGANLPGCPIGAAPTLAISGGGGYGGTFATVGGDGGESLTRGAKGVAPTTLLAPVSLRGGCPGVAGAGNHPGTGGAGGGALELVAPSIAVSGRVNASGAGGEPGVSDDSGGGGGGSGGMIVFDAAMHVVTGVVMTQGGGGGGGSGGAGSGTPGADPTAAGVGAVPGDGYHAAGGLGGAGGAGAVAADAGDAQAGSGIGGGGGGGGGGVIRISAP
jgi:hypothetical protein